MAPLSAQQIAQRTGVTGWIGASEVAAALGVSRWQKPIDLWLKKTRRAPEEQPNPRAEIGHRAERILFGWYCEDERVDPEGFYQGKSQRHPEFSFAGCTPDFVRTDGKLLVQAKCVGANMAREWPEADEVPSDVECQCQFEMEVTGAEENHVAVWLGGTDFRIIKLQRDREFGKMLIQGAETFWRFVADDEPPPIDGSESWRVYLTRKYPRVEREELETATREVESWAHESLRAREKIDELSEDQEAANNHLRDLIGNRAGYIGSDFKVSWRADRNGKRTLLVKRRKTNQ